MRRSLSVRRMAAVAFFLLLAGCTRGADRRPDPLPDYTRASGAEHAAIARAVADYYVVRQRAVMLGDASALFGVYPKLAKGEDLRQGLNLDAFFIRQMRDGGVTKVTNQLELSEPIRTYVKGNAAVAFVQGMESWHYPNGGPGSGAFFTRIDLVNDYGRWIVENTDEQMMAEPPPRLPNR